MNANLIIDRDLQNRLSGDLQDRIIRMFKENGHRVDVFEIVKNEVSQCIGCLLCLTKHPGECVNKDIVNDIRKNVKKYSATFFLTPILFGHYSSAIASAINKGTGSHNWQVIIGFCDDIDDEEESTFIDLTAKHRGKADIVHPGMDRRVDVFVSRSIEDNTKIIETITALAR